MSAFISSDNYVLAAKVISVLSLVSSTIILLYHSVVRYQNYNNNTISVPQDKKMVFSVIVLYGILLSSFVFSFLWCLHMFEIVGPFSTLHTSCWTLNAMTTLTWSLNKVFLYFSYFLRLQISYNESIFAINKYFAAFLYISSSLYFMWLVFWCTFLTKQNQVFWNDEYKYCYKNTYINRDIVGVIHTIFIIGYEFIVSILTLTLFLKPLCSLKKMQHDTQLHDTIIKVGLLNIIMIISSILFFMIFSVTMAGIFIAMDNFVNSLCVILMFDFHKELYQRLCSICISCKCCQYSTNNDVEFIKSNIHSDTKTATTPNSTEI